jgi:single-strand DNA-binding protein
MSGETVITVIGNLTADPELRYTPSGAAVASFTIASTPRTFDRSSNEWKDGEALFLRCSIWRQAAEHASECLQRGTRVIATGRLKQRSFETREGRQAHRDRDGRRGDRPVAALRHRSREPRRTRGRTGRGGSGRYGRA